MIRAAGESKSFQVRVLGLFSKPYLALSVKTALSLTDGKNVFHPSPNFSNIIGHNNIYDTQFLEYQIANLIQLLDFSEQEMLRQAARFQRTIDKLQRELADRKNKEQLLQTSSDPFTDILNFAEDAIVTLEENQGIQRFNQGQEKI